MRNRLVGRFCISLVFIFVCAGLIQAAYLRNVPVHVKQPDGTVLSCLASGDEFYNWLHDKDGYTIVRNPATGFLVFADKVNGKLVPTEFIAGRTDPQFLVQAGIQKRLLDDPKPREPIFGLPQGEPIVNVPKTGTINNLVVYIRFSDQEEFAEALIDAAEEAFNSAAAGVNSFRNYFAEVSYNQLTIGTTFYPGSTPGVFSYQDSYPRAYYMPYDATTNPAGYTDDQRTTREHTLLQNAVNAISAEVPGGLNIDADSDSYVDNICFIVKGEPTAWNTLLWPHKWALYSYNVYINTKRVYTYNFQMESTVDVGVLCHEMFHSLGAPDLYHYSYDGLHPAWAWDLMEYNLDPPEHMTAYMKWKYGTWIASIPQITTSGTYTLHPLASSTNNCYKIASPGSSTEFFVVEYRKKTNGGTFESSLYNEGLLVYRINTTCTGNASGPPDELYIYRPNGTPTVDGSPALAPFSANQARTQINDSTNPSSFLTSGLPGGLSISNVGYYGDTISFDVAINTITVTSPNGGESWAALGTAAVTWMSTGTMSTVDILLTTDGGTTWTALAENTANDGTETVAVPLVASASCFVRVREGVSGVPYDESNASFSIVIPTSPIVVTSPNGGERWAVGTSHNITWTQTGLSGTATIDLYKNWIYQKTLGTAAVTAGTFSWAIGASETAGSDYRIRITQGTVWDISDVNFSLVVPKTLPFNEDFSTTTSGWTQQNVGAGIGSLWSFSATNNAGGVANEVTCRWWEVNPGTTRLISPPLDTMGLSSLRLRFKHFLNAFATGCVLKIQTSPDRSNWADESWSINSTSSDVGPETVETVLEHNLGIATTYIAFVITGNLYQYDFWYIDDISISNFIPKVDFNGDGQEDILWRNYGTGAYQGLNVIWLMNPGGGLSPLKLEGISAAGQVGSVLVGTKSGTDDRVPIQPGSRLAVTPNKRSSKTIVEGGKVPGLRTRQIMKDPMDVGKTALRSKRGEVRGQDPRLRTILKRNELLDTTALSSGDIKLASFQMGTEIVFSQVADLDWEIIAVGDFDGDGDPDLIWRNMGTGPNKGLSLIWYMNGTQFVSEAFFSWVADTDWRIVGTGDFDGDGDLDILWRYCGAGANQGLNIVWYLNGLSYVEAVYSKVMDLDWEIVGTGDFDGDGDPDILWRNTGTGPLQGLNIVWYMNGMQFASEAVYSWVADTDWEIAGTGDLDRDGDPDILWRNYGTGPLQGVNVVWYMNGMTFVSEEVFSIVADTSWRILNR
jgi:M6 family metalloprotease-like protein